VLPALASVTRPLSKSDFPSLNACHEAAALIVASVHPLIVAGVFRDRRRLAMRTLEISAQV
jgi:hypothetical protein